MTQTGLLVLRRGALLPALLLWCKYQRKREGATKMQHLAPCLRGQRLCHTKAGPLAAKRGSSIGGASGQACVCLGALGELANYPSSLQASKQASKQDTNQPGSQPTSKQARHQPTRQPINQAFHNGIAFWPQIWRSARLGKECLSMGPSHFLVVVVVVVVVVGPLTRI
jgi:hypothetical protein